MSKQVNFTIKLRIDGKDQFVSATTSSKALADSIGLAKTKADVFRQSILQLNQLTQVFQNLASGVQQFANTAKQFTMANGIQVEAETKLATAMRNTMNATDAEVQSIKNLASAQQQLGVVGDEIQLAGAGQLAVFVKQQSSLQALIPVMNDMIAKQQGLNATQEGAVSVASMLGKALNGTTTTLERAGYILTDAQKEILKLGTEQEKVAVLSDAISKAVGGMNAELAKTDAGKAKQMSNDMGDLKERIGAMLAPYQSLIEKASEFSIIAMGATNILGGVGGVLNFLKSKLDFASTALGNTAVGFKYLVKEEQIAIALSNKFSVSIKTATLALRGLMSVGIMAVISGAIYLVQKLTSSTDNLVGSVDKLKESENVYIEEVGRIKGEMQSESDSLAKLITAKADTKDAVQRLNEKYGEAFGYYKTAAEWYDVLTSKSEAYSRQMGYEAQAVKLQSQIDTNNIRKEYLVGEQRRLISEGKAFSGIGIFYGPTKEFKKIQDEIKGINKENVELNKQLDIAKTKADEFASTLGSVTTPVVTPTTVPTSGNTSNDKELELISAPKTLKELQNNVSYYSQQINIADKSNEQLVKSLFEMKEGAERAVAAFNMLKFDRPDDLVRSEEPISFVEKIKSDLEELKDFKIDLHIENTEAFDNMKKKLDNMIEMPENISKIAGAVSQLGQSMAGLAEESKGMQVAMAGVSVAAAIAQLVAVMVKKLSESFTIWDFIAGTIAGTAAVVSAITQLKSVAAFAQGGIVSGPTMALVGEYVGAQNNPEVIAPLDRLRSMMQPAGFDGGLVHFKIEGRDLVGVIKKENDHSRRS